MLAYDSLRDLDGLVISGCFGERGTEGKIAAAGYAREHGIPCLGLCLGLQMMTIDYARNVLGLAGANSREMEPTTQHPAIALMEPQRGARSEGRGVGKEGVRTCRYRGSPSQYKKKKQNVKE